MFRETSCDRVIKLNGLATIHCASYGSLIICGITCHPAIKRKVQYYTVIIVEYATISRQGMLQFGTVVNH